MGKWLLGTIGGIVVGLLASKIGQNGQTNEKQIDTGHIIRDYPPDAVPVMAYVCEHCDSLIMRTATQEEYQAEISDLRNYDGIECIACHQTNWFDDYNLQTLFED